jgi:hypothetical protein
MGNLLTWAKPMEYSEAMGQLDCVFDLPPLTNLFKSLSGHTVEHATTTATGTSAPSISRDSFVRFLVSKGMAAPLATEFFRVFTMPSGTSSLSYHEFLRLMGTVCKGTLTNKTWYVVSDAHTVRVRR